ncbi:MAG: hypothetical protein ACTHJR_10780 [Sphingomonas sp.]|uniref:hypothetical protein n=1 Tax=Sphingomonas sp. TaxID=28214 RepID=UPI003F7E1758
MSRNIINAVCTTIGVGSLVAGAFVAIHPTEVRTMSMPQFQLDRLQRLAETSCRCERRAGRNGAAKCWAEFERRMPGADMQSMCEPSVHSRCAGKGMLGGNDCVVMQYYFEGYQLCSSVELKTMEAVFNAELDATHGKGPLPKTEKLYRDMVAGKPLPKLNGSSLCTSS